MCYSQWGLHANDLAIQVHGGYGYTRDYDVEGRVAESAVDEWRATMSVNVVGAVALTLALLPALRATGGHVVFINSGAR